jgi:peptidoglycan hydrolase-like protein with peptidoglycan-binding domain
VLERTYGRNDSRITGYGVPRWSMAGGHEPIVDVTNVWEDTGELEVDGFLGVQSVTAWQVALGTVADGFVSSQPWRCYGNTPNLVGVERCYGAEGSSLVRAVQRVVGADVDGLMGPQTVRCLQAWLNSHGFDCGAVDGVLGTATAKAIQRSLNAGAWS